MKNIDFLGLRTERKYAQIFNVGLNSTSVNKVLVFVRDSLGRNRKFSIVTPNPEIILAAQGDKDLADAISKASLVIPDGIGLSQAARFLSLPAPKNTLLRIPVCFLQGLWVGLSTFLARNWVQEALPTIKGRKLFMELIKLANKKGWRVFFLGGEKGEAKGAGEKLRRSFKRVRIAYSQGPMLNADARPKKKEDKEIERNVLREINEFKPDILFVAFGASKQEKWLMKWLGSIEVGGAMAVGGTFRYFSGDAKLPPTWMEEFGLEWVWRLITEPWRVKRVLTAFPAFPLKVFLSKLNTP
ncbi:WecB/TagA/CpsF family glycosyltransferase [Candidatus Woesebacteria bacterium]|nr:WecB/TagA/CpsF family glycosyltransferase [Candidatus Woesebacteria bacterium]